MRHVKRHWALAAAVMGVTLAGGAQAAEYTWTPTAAGNNYDWNAATSNWGSGFPSEAGDVANLNNNIAGNQTVRLQQDITIGTLNLGDADGSHSFTVSSGSGSNTLTFDSGSAAEPAYLNVTNAGTVTHTVSAGISLNSDLVVALPSGSDEANRPNLTFSGPININGKQLIFTGGYVPTSGGDFNQLWVTGGDTLIGNGTIINNGDSPLVLNGVKTSFTGKFILNGQGKGGSNTSTLTVTTSSVLNASEIVINGYVRQGQGLDQMGGTYHQGSQSTVSINPGQRITQNKVTFNGGSATLVGQPASAGATPWLEVNETAEVVFNSGYSLVSISSGGGTLGNHWNITTVTRETGASAYLRSGSLGDLARVTAANGESLGVGFAFTVPGSDPERTVKVVPWLQANNANAFGQNGRLAVYDPEVGFRAMADSERIGTLATGVNYRGSNLNLASLGDLTVNSIAHSSGGIANIGAGRVLTVASGAVYFETNGGGIGAAGNENAGTLNFGSAEGVIWSLGSSGTTHVNTIGAVIDGTGGLTKAGTGILVLAATNIYSGQTSVGAGTLQIGDGVNVGTLGSSERVEVAAGALLKIMNNSSIDDSAAVVLSEYGLFNGMLELADGVNETVGALYFGEELQAFGTWGSSLSDAQYKNDTFFSGTGILTVVPEPATVGVISIGLLALLRRQRRGA